MDSPYPVDIVLEDVREAIAGCPEFFEKEEDDLIIFNYRFCNSKTFPSPESCTNNRTKLLFQLKRECRGLIFSKIDHRVIARRYHKFFNIGETPETQPDRIDLTRPYHVMTKYDGKLVTPVRTNGIIRFASKSGFGDVTKILEDRFFPLEENSRYTVFSAYWLDKGYTPIFEWCSPRTKIVLFYESDILVLTGIRSNETGFYVSYDNMTKCAAEYNIPVADMHKGTLNNLTEFMHEFQSKVNIEGVVIRFDDDGTMYKVKTEWYFEKSKKEKQEFSLNSERSIWGIILNQEIDDALAFVNDAHLSKKVREFEIILYKAISNTTDRFGVIIKKYQHLDKKNFVDAVRKDQSIPKEIQPILFKLYGKPQTEWIDIVLESIKSCCNSASSLEKARKILGGIKFLEQ